MTDQQQYPINPSWELQQQWREQAPRYRDGGAGREHWLIDRAAQWGYDQRGEVNEAKLQEARDQELEACCEWLRHEYGYGVDLALKLRAARRPSLQSLKEKALKEMDKLDAMWDVTPIEDESLETIRKALEALPDDL